MPIFILSTLIQIALVVHIIKTRRDTMWIWIVVGLPIAGSIAYLIVEVIPKFLSSNTGQVAKRNIEKVVNPDKDFNDAMYRYSVTDTVKNSLDLAEACMEKKKYEDAKTLYENCLTGVHKSDPIIMFGLARAEFALGNYARVKSLLNDLIRENPDYENIDAHLLYAKSLEGLGEKESALEVYEALESYSPSPEALYRYAMLHLEFGNQGKARELLEKIIRTANISGKHHNSVFRNWINLARDELKK